MNIALFFSGRILNYENSLTDIINNIKENNSINILKLFFSINKFSLDKNESINFIENNLKNLLKDYLGNIYYEDFKLPKEYVKNKITNNVNNFPYNQLSCTYNDMKNYELIDNFENDNNLCFDIICKSRTDNIFNSKINFIKDNKDDLIIRNKHIMDLRYWGHNYYNTPRLVSDCFAYGNKKSMKIYCKTYNWILEKDLELKGLYLHALEIVLTDSILNYVFYNIPGGGQIPILSHDEIINKYNFNSNNIKIIYDDSILYNLIPTQIRSKNNFNVNINNVLEYTKNI
jgi:hypothetical protein